jgi:protein-tyrosine-phosphatase
MKLAFVCVQNAGRSQMAAAFARELAPPGVVVLSGGTRPAERVNPIVAQAMEEVGIDIKETRPRAITPADLEDSEVVVTMGCDAEEVCPANFHGSTRDWAIPDPKGRSLDEVRRIRDEVRGKVVALLAELREKGSRQTAGVP